MRTGLSVVLWAMFAAVVVAGAGVLLRACGILMPLAVAAPGLAWDFCPSAPASLSAEAERGEALRKLVRQLERDLADKALACASIPPPPPPPLDLPTRAGTPRPQQTALLKPPPPPPPPPKPPEPAKPPPALPADRWAQKDLSLLQGCWVLGQPPPWVIYAATGDPRRTARQPPAGCASTTGAAASTRSASPARSAAPTNAMRRSRHSSTTTAPSRRSSRRAPAPPDRPGSTTRCAAGALMTTGRCA